MEFTIHDLKWNIKFVDGISCEDTDEQLCGVTFKLKQEIVIDYNAPDDMLLRIITHELVHAFIWSYGFECFKPFTEEQLCSFIESYIVDINYISKRIYDECIEYKYKEKFEGKS